MKRNLLLLAVMIWVAFGFSLAQAVQDPNDPGVADTLYLEVYPGDDGLLAYPADVKFPMFITNDIPNAVTDSIAGIVIPLCFTSTNAGANATIDIAKNNTNIFPFPDLENSIFQHLPTMDTLTATDRNFLMDIGYGFKTWATRELVLTGGTTFWVSLIPSGSADPRFPGGSRVLTATVTFTIDDSTNICLDTCFWPPTNRLAFARSDAVTYIPQIWDDYIPAEEVCVELYTVPNIPPVVNCPSNQSHSQNGVVNIPGPPFTATDTDGNVTTLAISFVGAGVGFEQLTGVSGLGTPSALFGVQYQVTDHCAAGGIMTITATDNQGGLGTCTFQVGLTNDNPVITCPTPNPADFYTDGTKTLNAQATATDANGDAYTFSAPGAPAGFVINTTTGAITWTPDVLTQLGAHAITLRATDACGAFHECIYTVNVLELLYDHEVHIGYPGDWEPAPQDCYVPGEMVFWPIIIRGFGDEELGGFDLHVDFDYTSMTFVGAERGELIPEPTLQTPGFEKFTYRLLPCPACGCCKYKILLFGMYDMPDGVVGAPIAGDGILVWLRFVINNDENLRGMTIPVCWQWQPCVEGPNGPFDPDCAENTFSDVSGNMLYTSRLLCQFDPLCCDDPLNEINDILKFQPYGEGAVVDCEHICGGIPICPPGGEFCKRGDVNYNGVAYEVADAVLFASYFVTGLSVFGEEAYQVCATDVNADGRPLTLGDLVYLIRVILHDAVEIPKLTPSSEVANVIVSNGIISTECAAPIGAILFEFDGAVDPTLLADMQMVHNGNKVLVWSSTGKSFSTAEVLSVDAELVSVSAVDRDSRELTTTITAKVAPTAFALHTAYPNPFNPFTNLSFNLPEAMNYSLKIYNVAGQLVRSYSGVGSQNLNVVTWDGKDNAGSEVSSGVYFYKLTAAGFSATEKMVMMK